jgi:2-hydroxychromene-2-carboxylate isomerase
LRGVARAAGLGEEAAETAWDPDRMSASRYVCEEALGTGVHAVPTIATKEEVL